MRAKTSTDSWVLWAVGVLLSLGIAALVEVKVRPALNHVWELWPYLFAAVGVAVGASAIANKVELQADWRWWAIPPLAAGVSAAMLFFWMRWWAGGLLTVLTALLYLQFAHAAYRAQIGHPLDDWPRW